MSPPKQAVSTPLKPIEPSPRPSGEGHDYPLGGIEAPRCFSNKDLREDAHDTSATSLYLAQIGRYPLLTPQQELELAARIKQGDEAAKEHMIQANLRLVVKIAGDYSTFGLPLMDLIAEGNIGLMKAVSRFDPEKGGKLSTYAAWWIKQHIKRALSNQSKTIRLPIHLVSRLAKIRRVIHALEEELQREPSNEEIALEMGLPIAKVAHLRTISMRPASLEAPAAPGVEESLGGIVADENAIDPANIYDGKSLLNEIDYLLNKLDPRYGTILRMRFGIGYEDAYLLDEVGEHLGITKERVRQLQEEGLVKLRALIEVEDAIRTVDEVKAERRERGRMEVLHEFIKNLSQERMDKSKR